MTPPPNPPDTARIRDDWCWDPDLLIDEAGLTMLALCDEVDRLRAIVDLAQMDGES